VTGRTLIAVLASALALAPAGAAAAPSLVVTPSSSVPGKAATTTLELTLSGPAEAVRVAVPPGVGVELPEPGTPLGWGSATVAQGAAPVVLTGGLAAVDPAACGAGAHAAVWRLSSAPGELLLAVDAVAADRPEAPFAAYVLAPCAAPSGEAPRVERLRLEVDGVFSNPGTAGRYAWRALVAPAGADTFELRAIVALPVTLTLSGSWSRARNAALLRGTLRAGGQPLAGRRVRLTAGGRPAGADTTDRGGRFQLARPIGAATRFRAASPGGTFPVPCDAPVVPGGCLAATETVGAAASAAVRVAPPPPPAMRLGSRGPNVRRLQLALARLHYLPPGSATGSFDWRTWHAVVAFQGWQGRSRTGVADRATWALLARAGVPRPWGGLRFGVEVDTARQVLFLVRGGTVVRAIHVSTGAYGRTPRGRFFVRSKALRSWSVPFGVWMPYAQYFYGGFALHSYPEVPAYPASHGCIRLPAMEAPVVYAFTSVGMPVWVR
jgi:hypothetical protein